MILATRSALAADGDLLDVEQTAAIDVLIATLGDVAQGDDADAMDAAVVALAAGTESFAAERMNRGIQQALTGRSIDQV
jgi:molecular chaperone HscA